MAKEIIIAPHAGFCFGVKRAVDMATQFYHADGVSVKTLGPLIHNDDMIRRLEQHNIFAIDSNQIEQLQSNDVIVIRSHGIDPQTRERIKRTGAKIVDATCPYVETIHRKVARHYADGYQIVIVGDAGHPEVIAINGWCEHTAIITRDSQHLPELNPAWKVCVVAQTTEQLSRFEQVVDAIKAKCKDVVTYNTICNATKDRQASTREVARQVDLMIVIGGKNSSNTRKLVEIAQSNCKHTLFIENSSELPLEMIQDDQYQKIGITAGASTPDWVIQDVINALQQFVKE